jgi:hypothetical protein
LNQGVHIDKGYTTILHQQTNWKRLKTSRGAVPPDARQGRTSKLTTSAGVESGKNDSPQPISTGRRIAAPGSRPRATMPAPSGSASSNLMPQNGMLNLLRSDYGAIIRMILGKFPLLSESLSGDCVFEVAVNSYGTHEHKLDHSDRLDERRH